jgi:hypothetical protein
MDFNNMLAASQTRPDKKIVTVYRKENIALTPNFTVQPLLVNYFELTVAGAVLLPSIKSLLGTLPAVVPGVLAGTVSPGFYIEIFVSNLTGAGVVATFTPDGTDTIAGKAAFNVATTETWPFKAFVVGPTSWSIAT